MKTSIKLLLPVVAATITLASLANPASATVPAHTGDVPSVTVRYDNARLVTRAGVKDLHDRLFAAARSVCKQLDSRVLGLREQYELCVRDAVRRGVADVGNENLSKFHRYGLMSSSLAAR